MYNRFFSFGCSWTQFIWPTWADIIAKDLEIEHQNWGASGSGNCGIQSRFVEANNRFNFNETDLVIVQWSGWNREDRYNKCWKFGGNIFNNMFYDKKFIKKYWSYDNDLIKNSVAIKTTNDAYSRVINHQFSFGMPFTHVNDEISEYKFWQKPSHKTDRTGLIIEAYYKHLPQIEIPKFVNSEYKGRSMDPHPDVLSHLEIVEKFVYPKVFNKSSVRLETKEFFLNYYNDLSDLLSRKDTRLEMQSKVEQINRRYNFNLGVYHHGI